MNRPVAAILLAAGKSRRMGSCKQLLPLGETTVICRCLDALFKGGVHELQVVISEEGQDVSAAVGSYPVKITVNPDTGGDMASSVRVGREALDKNISGVIVSLCDYPLVSAGTIAGLIREHQALPDRIIVPCCNGKRGHPLLFPRPLLDRLAGGMTLRDLISGHQQQVSYLEAGDPGILVDMDTPEDYRRICAMDRN